MAWTAARQAEADSLRAAQAARAAKQGKGSKKRAPKKGAEPDGKKRALKTPVVGGWVGGSTGGVLCRAADGLCPQVCVCVWGGRRASAQTPRAVAPDMG